MQKQKLPVAHGQTIKLKIVKLNHDGEGVGRIEGFTVFVPGTVPGDVVNATIISLQKNYARALIDSIEESSPARVTPVCEHYAQCGGCQLQHITYEEQLKLKREIVRDALTRIGGLDVPVLPVLGMNNPRRYRNKAQVPVGAEDGVIKAGFFEKRSHRIVDLSCCEIQHPDNDLAVHAVRELLQKLEIPVYNEKNHTGLIRHILVRKSFSTGEVLLVLVTNGKSLPNKGTLVTELAARFENLAGIVQNINTKRGNVILGNEDILLFGQPYLTEKLHGLTFHISPRSFFQVNTVQTETLYGKVVEYAALNGTETVFDLYCGIGTIALCLAPYASKVIGVESVRAAVKDAQKNAKLNSIENTEFYAGLAEETTAALYDKGYRADVTVVDPPRKGCDRKLLDTMLRMRPARIVYVSCNPATLARDLKYLVAGGYDVTAVQPVDMFPHTSHVECVVLMSRVEK